MGGNTGFLRAVCNDENRGALIASLSRIFQSDPSEREHTNKKIVYDYVNVVYVIMENGLLLFTVQNYDFVYHDTVTL